MASLNKVMLMGNVTTDPELNLKDNVANFSIAVNERWTDKNGNRQERAEYINCTVWGKRVEFVEKYIKKGTPLFVEGKFRTNVYQDSKGEKKYAVGVVVENMELLPNGQGKSQETEQRQARPSAPAPQPTYTPSAMNENPDDDLPF